MNYQKCVKTQENLSKILTSDTPFDTPLCLYLEVFPNAIDTHFDTLAYAINNVRTHVKDNIIYIFI